MNRGVGQDVLTDLGDGLGTHQQVVSNCLVQHLSSLDLTTLPFLYYYSDTCISFAFFSDSPIPPLRELGGREQGAPCCLVGS